MKILITGYHGFVGRNLKPYLEAQGHEVLGLGREGKFTWAHVDADSLPPVDAIIHLAGKAHDTKNLTEADVYFQVNRDLTEKIYRYYLAHPQMRCFIFFSSVKAAADVVPGPVLTEDVTPAPVGPYGESKLQAEQAIAKLSLPQEPGRRTYILRPCMMHGPGNKGNLNLLYRVVSKGIPWPLGSFQNKRSFCSIGNVCFVVGKLLAGTVASGTYNLADDEALSTNELIQVICDALGRKAHIWRLPRGIMTATAHLGGVLHLPLNPERLAKLTQDYVVSNAKLKRALGIQSMPISARDGLMSTIRHFSDKEQSQS